MTGIYEMPKFMLRILDLRNFSLGYNHEEEKKGILRSDKIFEGLALFVVILDGVLVDLTQIR